MERVTANMIEEVATVVAVSDGQAWVETRRRSACGHCEGAATCGTATLAGLFGEGPNRLQIADRLGLRPGEQVMIGIADEILLRASLIAYLIPLIALVVAAGLGTALRFPEGAVALLGLTGLGAGIWLAGRLTGGAAGRERYRPLLARRLDDPDTRRPAAHGCLQLPASSFQPPASSLQLPATGLQRVAGSG